MAALFLLARYFPRIRPAQTASRRIDWVGGLLLIVVVGAPLAAIELAFAPGDGAHPRVALALAVAGIAAVALLVPIERRVRSPYFPPARAGRPRTPAAEPGRGGGGRDDVHPDFLQSAAAAARGWITRRARRDYC